MQIKTHGAIHLNEMKKEDRIILCNRNKPVAEVRLLPLAKQSKRQLGLAKGEFIIPDSFWEPLPEDILQAFYGEL